MTSAAFTTATPAGTIATKDELIAALTDAAAIEHQFMCQYLYAALSLKKSPDATCDDAQFEFVRRSAQTVYMIARQEMEHLSIVNSILTAIGGAPYFGHVDFPTQSRFFTYAAQEVKHGSDVGLLEPCEIPFVLEPFSLRAVRRFACMETPPITEVPAADRASIYCWGFHAPDAPCSAIVPPQSTRLAVATADVEVGTIQHLYLSIAIALRVLEAKLGEATLFSGRDSGQWEVQSEYGLFLFKVKDASSAVAALQMVMQQGEGLNAPPGFDSHFLNYHQMAVEYEQLLAIEPSFEPAKAVPLNPTLADFSDPNAQLAARTFNYGYVTLLYMLTGYYGLFDQKQFNQPNTYLTAALQYNAFAPMMTMFVRTLAEMLTEMPASQAPGAGRAAPVFDIPAVDLELLKTPPSPTNFYASASFYADRLAHCVAGLTKLSHAGGLEPAVATRLQFMLQNIIRLAANFTNIDTVGIYPGFNPNATS